MSERERILRLRENSKQLMLRMYGDQEYAERFADNPNVDPDAWLKLQHNAAQPEYVGRHRADVNKSDMPADVDEAFWSSLPEDRKTVWNDLSPKEKENLRNDEAAKKAQAGITTAEAGVEGEPAQAISEPITDTSPKGMKARWSRLVSKTWAGLQTLKHNTLDYYSNEEKGKRRKIITVAAGALAIAGTGVALYLESRGHNPGHTLPPKKPSAGDGTVPPHVPAAPNPINHFQTVNLVPGTGDSLWHEEVLHHPHASQQEIWNRVQQDLKINHLTSEEARHIWGAFKITK